MRRKREKEEEARTLFNNRTIQCIHFSTSLFCVFFFFFFFVVSSFEEKPD